MLALKKDRKEGKVDAGYGGDGQKVLWAIDQNISDYFPKNEYSSYFSRSVRMRR